MQSLTSTQYLLSSLFEYWLTLDGCPYPEYSDSPESAIKYWPVADEFYAYLGYELEMYSLDAVGLGSTSKVQDEIKKAYHIN